jgi:hypothetical protein
LALLERLELLDRSGLPDLWVQPERLELQAIQEQLVILEQLVHKAKLDLRGQKDPLVLKDRRERLGLKGPLELLAQTDSFK